MQEISVSAIMIMLVVLILFGFLYETGKKKYKEYLIPLTKQEFPLKELLVVGFSILDWMHYSYHTAWDRKNRKYLRELYDPAYTEFYLRVYWAQAMTYSMLALLLGAVVNLVLGDSVIGAAIGLGLGILLPYVAGKDLEKKVEKRHRSIAMDMPGLVNKIVILTGAGLTLQGALSKITKEMYSDSVLYQELNYAITMIDAGESADTAFYHMGIRCNMVEIRRFIAIITQNIHRGSSDVSIALKEIGEELWRTRKATALRIAEEASTKMLFPMMLMLFAVILLVIAPAIQSMQL